MRSQNVNFGQAAPIIALDDTGLNTLRRQSAAAPKEPPPPPLSLDALGSFEAGASISESIILEDGGPGGLSRRMVVVLGVMVLGLAFVHFTGDHEDPLENFSSFFQEMLGSEELTVASSPASESAPVKEAFQNEGVPGFSAEVVPNPYWVLPNDLEKVERPKEAISPEDNELYTNGLNHRYTYQRYRTAKEVRASKRLGAAGFLAKASSEPKFWTRMEGGLGLMEQGYALDIAATERLLGDARPSLVYNYMQRFVKKPSAAEIYFMKQAIRLVDARTRLHILKILSRDLSRHELYFAAAQYDPSSTVTDWMAETLGDNVVNPEVLRQYQAMALEDVMRRGQNAPKRDNPAPTSEPITVRAEELKIDDEVVEDVAVFSEGEAEGVPKAEEVFSKPNESDDGFGGLINLRGGEAAAP